jgi:hypothetical protein
MAIARPQKISVTEMRATGIHALLYCADYKCSDSIEINGDR